MYLELGSNKVLMIIFAGGIFTVVCWATYQYYNVAGADEIIGLAPTINNSTYRWPYEGWESFSENDDWVHLERVI